MSCTSITIFMIYMMGSKEQNSLQFNCSWEYCTFFIFTLYSPNSFINLFDIKE